MGAQNESDRSKDPFRTQFKREVAEIVAQRRVGEGVSKPTQTTDGQLRTRDLAQTLDLLEGLQHILSSFHEEQRGRHKPDPLIQALKGIHSHGYNWEALRYQDGVGEGWAYIVDSIEELRTRLLYAYAHADH